MVPVARPVLEVMASRPRSISPLSGPVDVDFVSAVVTAMPVPAWLKDRAGRYLAVNEPFAHLVGLSLEAILDAVDGDLFARAVADQRRRREDVVLSSAEDVVADEMYVEPDGTTTCWRVHRSPVVVGAAVVATLGLAQRSSEPCSTRTDLLQQLARPRVVPFCLDGPSSSLPVMPAIGPARQDQVDALPDRATFGELLERSLHRGDPVGVLLLDIDRFKSINDGLGHLVGDRLLGAFAERLCAETGPDLVVASLGGDEFAVLIDPLLSVADLAAMAERLRCRMAAPIPVNGRDLHVTVSIGAASSCQDPGLGRDLLRFADSALAEAKRLGRDNVQFFSAELSAATSRRVDVEQELRMALEREELSLVYQPIVSLFGRRIVGAEALLRWQSPVLGEVAPDVFIPIAEEIGVITRIGNWILDQVAATSRRLNQRLPEPIPISVNVSARQFLRHDLVGAIAESLRRHRCPAAWLNIEITESVLMADDDDTRAALRQLSDLGMRIAIDDFGTGFSSLSYLAAFPSHDVKIDRSFVAGLQQDGENAIVRAIIGMASRMHKRAIAEGIETEEQAAILERWGCHCGQGFLFGMPMPAENLQRLVRSQRRLPIPAGPTAVS